MPPVASKYLAPTQCQALEAKAEELSPPRVMGGGGVCPGFLSAVSGQLCVGGRAGRGVLSFSQKVVPEDLGLCDIPPPTPRCKGEGRVRHWPGPGA